MAVLAAVANGNLTTSTTWALVDSTSYSNSETANTLVTTSLVASSTFTPGTITVDGIALKIASRAASPTGTITAKLTLVAGLVDVDTVTVNVSDLPTCTATSGTTTPVGTAEGGWFFFKFGSSHVLVGASAYEVRVSTSSSNQVNLWSTATTNWSRYLRTTTTQAPVAGDDLIITGEWTAAATVTARTVTMNSTAATNYGSNTTSQVTPATSICNNGTLSFATSASTNYIFQQSGYVVVYNGGIYSQGVSGTEIPRNSTAIVQFNCASDGDFGLVARNGSTVNMYGLSRTSGKNFSQTKLNADASAGATSITIVDDTGWLSGDVLAFAPTSQTSTQFESKAATGNATATTIAVSALTNAHSGTAPTQGEVGLLTRNNQFIAVTANVVTFFYIATTATVNCSWTDFRYISTNASGKTGITINTTTGSCSIDFCTIRDADANWIIMTGAALNNVTITNTVMYNCFVVNSGQGAVTVANATTGTWTISGCMLCGSAGSGAIMFNAADIGGTFSNNSVSGGTSTATSSPAVNYTEAADIGTFSGNNIHSNGVHGFATTGNADGTVSNCNFWRHTNAGYLYGSTVWNPIPLTFSGCNFFGNTTACISAISTASTPGILYQLVLSNCTLAGDTTFATTNGISFASGSGRVTLYSSQFSVVSGIKAKMTNDINFGTGTYNILADDSTFNGTNVVTTVTNIQPAIFFQAQNYGGVANDNRTFVGTRSAAFGIIKSNAVTVFGSNPLSEEMQPAISTIKLVSQSIFVECLSGKAATPIVQVQKNSSYNGNAARLIVKRQDSIGVTADTVLATFSSGANVWQALTGTTVAATQDGVFEFVIDCDGTAGSVFVGDATATTA